MVRWYANRVTKVKVVGMGTINGARRGSKTRSAHAHERERTIKTANNGLDCGNAQGIVVWSSRIM